LPLSAGTATCDDGPVQPLSALPRAAAASLTGLLFDIDDTVLDAGRLSVGALDALYRMAAAGLTLVGVTGRPASWGQVLARQWPVDGMVTENGAICFARRERALELLDRLSPEQRRQQRRRLEALVAEMRTALPDLHPSDDVSGRISDYSFDIAEARSVPEEVVMRAILLARSRGARAVRSSIHLHVSFDGDDKASGALRFLHALCGLDVTAARARFAFVGDSENDAPCFAAFQQSIAVQNLSGRPSLLPRYQTTKPSGAGFCEVADALIAARR
jgi:HAD superfamily hydrolase (TIGR01484 family)